MPQPTFLSNIRGDLFGGLTAGIVALPLALAFGEQTALGAIAGLYGAIAIGILAAVFGGTATQISGPTAPMTVVSAVVIVTAMEEAGGSLEQAIPIILATFFAAGAIQIAMGLSGVGRYVKYIPYPVVSGFMSGIGIIIIVTQLFPFVGAVAPSGGALGTIQALRSVDDNINLYSIGVAFAAIALIYLSPRVTRAVPGALVALLILTPVVLWLLPAGSVTLLSSGSAIPSGLPSLQFDLFTGFASYNQIGFVLKYGATLAALGAIDSLLTSVVADNITRTRHDSRRELIGQGIGNLGAALVGGLPGAGATVRTVVNVNAGGRTRLSGVIAGLLLLAILLGLGSLVGYIPNAVLAGILITVGIGIIDYRGLRHLSKVSRADAVVLLVVLALTVFVDLLTAVGVGMVLASVLFMKRTADESEAASTSSTLSAFAKTIGLADVDDVARVDDAGDELLGPFKQRVYVKHLEGSLFFGFAAGFRKMVADLPDIDVLILDLSEVPSVDQTGLYALEDAILDLERKGDHVLIVGLRPPVADRLRGIGLLDGLISPEHIFEDLDQARVYLIEHLRAGGSLEALSHPLDPTSVREV